MANQATGQSSTRRPLSSIIRDPALRAAFERSERDQGTPPLLPVQPAPQPRKPLPLATGAAVEVA